MAVTRSWKVRIPFPVDRLRGFTLTRLIFCSASETTIANLEPRQTSFVYFRFVRSDKKLDTEQTPEVLTTKAIERLIVGADEKPLGAGDISLDVSSLSLVGISANWNVDFVDAKKHFSGRRLDKMQ